MKITLKVPGMHCPKCVERIGNALEASGISGDIDLDAKTVTVEDGCCDKVIEILDDLGFDAEK